MIAISGYDTGTSSEMSGTCPCCGQATDAWTAFSRSLNHAQIAADKLNKAFEEQMDKMGVSIKKKAIKATETMVKIGRQIPISPQQSLYVKKFIIRKIMFSASGHVPMRLRKRFKHRG